MREDQHSVTVVVDGQNLGVWDKKSGTEGDSSETKYRPGGMGDEVVLGGAQTMANETVSRLYDKARDHELARGLMAKRGRAAMSLTFQPLDDDGNVYGKPMVTSGKLKRVKLPDLDSEGDGAALWELEMSTAGPIG